MGAAPVQLSFDPPVTGPEDPSPSPPAARRAQPQRYSVAEAADLLRITPGALRRRAAAGVISFGRTEWGECFVTQEELARHVSDYTPGLGGRPALISDEILARMEALRQAGWSYARISALLILDGVSTVHGGRRWWPSSVRAAVLGRVRR